MHTGLIDVFEFLKKKSKILSLSIKKEALLFTVANGFASKLNPIKFSNSIL
jgi:hypothetical protein